MKLIGAAFGIAAMCAAGVAAQTQTTQTTTKRKVEIKDGKDIKVNGCLQRSPAGGYLLAVNDSAGMKYALITDDDLSKHVGDRVEIRGKAADRGDAKVTIESKTGTSGSTDEVKGTTKTTLEGDLDLHYLSVKSLKRIATTCM